MVRREMPRAVCEPLRAAARLLARGLRQPPALPLPERLLLHRAQGTHGLFA